MGAKIHLKGKKIPFNKRVLKRAILDYLNHKGFLVDTLLLSFITDDEILKINQDFLKHDYYTDIITFDYSSAGVLRGELYISMDRVRDNAFQYECDFKEELMRVIAHGLLHLMGYKDKTRQEKGAMRKEENFAIEFFKSKMFHVEQKG